MEIVFLAVFALFFRLGGLLMNLPLALVSGAGWALAGFGGSVWRIYDWWKRQEGAASVQNALGVGAIVWLLLNSWRLWA